MEVGSWTLDQLLEKTGKLAIGVADIPLKSLDISKYVAEVKDFEPGLESHNLIPHYLLKLLVPLYFNWEDASCDTMGNVAAEGTGIAATAGSLLYFNQEIIQLIKDHPTVALTAGVFAGLTSYFMHTGREINNTPQD